MILYVKQVQVSSNAKRIALGVLYFKMRGYIIGKDRRMLVIHMEPKKDSTKTEVDKVLVKALEAPILKKGGKTYGYDPKPLSQETLSYQCTRRGILLLHADSSSKEVTDESKSKMALDRNKELQTFILSFDDHEHSEGFALLKRGALFFLLPFSTDEYTNWINKEHLHNLVAEKLGVEKQNLIFISKEHLDSLQADPISCHTMALTNCIKTKKHPSVIEDYVTNALKSGRIAEKNGIMVLETSKYYPFYVSLSQSLSKLSGEDKQHLDHDYASELFISQCRPDKQINPKLQLKTIQYSSKEGEDNVKKFKKGESIKEPKNLGRFQTGCQIDPPNPKK
jgi:hypothetical protein